MNDRTREPAELLYHHRSVSLRLARHGHLLSAGELERVDYVFTLESGRLRKLKDRGGR